MLALGHHLENAEGDYAAAESSYSEALALAQRIGDVPAQIELHAALAQLAFYRCDWEQVGALKRLERRARRTRGPGRQAVPVLHRCGGCCSGATASGSPRPSCSGVARELAEQVGWSEVAFNALLGLAVTERDRGDYAAAEATIAQALDVCERAGLVGQSIQATSMRALMLVLVGEHAHAQEVSERASDLAKRVHYPLGEAAVLEARGMTAELPDALELLRGGQTAWEQLGRPLDAARCELLLGQRSRGHDAAGAEEALAGAAAAYERLGVKHLAMRARDLMVA